MPPRPPSSPSHPQCDDPLVSTLDSFLSLHTHTIQISEQSNVDTNECSICWNKFGEAQYEDETPEGAVKIDPCGHVFGKLCLEKHFSCNPEAATCPTCRTSLYGLSLTARRALLERGGSPEEDGFGGEESRIPSLPRLFGEAMERVRKRRRPSVQAARPPPNARPSSSDGPADPRAATQEPTSRSDSVTLEEQLMQMRQRLLQTRELFNAQTMPRLPAEWRGRSRVGSGEYEMNDDLLRRLTRGRAELRDGEGRATRDNEGDA